MAYKSLNNSNIFLIIVFLILKYACNISAEMVKDTLLSELSELSKLTKEGKPDWYEQDSKSNKKIWENYYNCLDKIAEIAMHFGGLPTAGVSGREGGTARLECDLCLNPGRLGGPGPEWRRFGEELAEDDSTVVMERQSGRLGLFLLSKEQAGLYQCVLGQAVSRPTLLHVVSGSEGLALVRGSSAKKGPKASPSEEIVFGSHSLRVFQGWSEWSGCSRCDAVGRRHKFGPCMVKIIEGQEVRRKRGVHSPKDIFPKIKNYLSDKWNNNSIYFKSVAKFLKNRNKQFYEFIGKDKDKSDERWVLKVPFLKRIFGEKTVNSEPRDKALTDEEIGLFEMFPEGLPCTSKILPESIRQLKELKERKNEIMEGYCKPPCVDEIFEVKDSLGKMLEFANNSGGVFSMLQGPPDIPPVPVRSSLFIPIGAPLTIACPGRLHLDVPFYWTIGRKARVYPDLLSNQTKGRVSLNLKEELVFKETEPTDSALYVCWQRDSIAGIVRLVVFDPAALKFDHHILYLGLVLILSTFAYIFLRIYLNRKQAYLG